MTTHYFSTEKKSILCILVSAGMILSAAFLFSLAADQPHILIIAVCGIIISLIKRRPVKYNHRTVIYSLVIAFVLAVIFDLIAPLNDDRFYFLAGVLAANITVPVIVYIAVMVTFFPSGPYQLGVCAALSILVTMFCGDYFYKTIPNERFIFFADWLQNFDFMYVLVILVELACLLLALHLAYIPKHAPTLPKISIFKKRFLMLISLTAACAVSIGIFSLFKTFEDEIHKLEFMLLRHSVRRFMGRSKIVFRNEIDLNRTLNPHDRNLSTIVLRAVSPSPPGYLRGRIYTHYLNGRWQSSDTKFSNLNFAETEGIVAINSFFRKGKKPPAGPASIDIFPVNYHSDVLLVPGQAYRFDAVADRMNISHYGMIKTEDWKQSAGYTVHSPDRQQDTAYQHPAETKAGELLDVPREIQPKIAEYLQAIMMPTPDVKPIPELSSREKLNRISAHFANNFEYSLEARPGTKNTDPVISFLKQSRVGHCELFASATAMLLRQAEIPARYVTGFICEEPHPSNEYYVARLGNAHAWIEAYLPDEQRWVLVENTPASGIPNFRPEWGIFETWTDRIRQIAKKLLANMQRGHFAEAIITVSSGIYSFVRDFLIHPLRGPGLLLLAVTLLIMRQSRINKKRTGFALPEEIRALQKEFSGMERKLGKVTGKPRPENIPISDWIRELDYEHRLPEKIKRIVSQYQEMRFRETRPQSEEIKIMICEIRKLNEPISKL